MGIGKQIAQIALEIKAIKLSPNAPFTWASGYKMPVYNDSRLLLCRADYRALIADGFCGLIAGHNLEADVIAGTATAGIPHATTLADRLKKPLIYVRDKAKDHGLENRIEGRLEKGQKIIMVEDLVSTGGSSVSSIQAIRESGGIIDACLCIFSYGLEKGEKQFADINCGLFALLTFETLLGCAIEKKYVSQSEQQLLAAWQKDPFSWGEKHGFPPAKKAA